MVDAKEVRGTWRLVAYEQRLDSGETLYPFGRDAVGQLMYSDDGYMAVAIMQAGRTPASGNGPFDGTTAELAAAARSYLAYTGRYELRGDFMLHHVDMSLIARWAGTTQERLITLEDGRLVLTTPRFVSADLGQVARLVWERTSPTR